MRYANRLSAVFIFIFSLLSPLNSYADTEFHQEVTSRRGVQQPFWMIERDNAVASLVLFAGGKGKLKINEDGIGKQNNFLVRTRRMFANHGFNVAVVDIPEDRGELYGFRTTAGHARDVQALIHYLRNKYKKPVWLIGTSRGTLSVANAAARLKGVDGPDGIVLTASVVLTNRHQSLNDIELGNIKVPALFVHNKDDRCHVCPFARVADVMTLLGNTPDKALQVHAGGRNEQSNQCKALTPHGFLGLEEAVVREIVAWVKHRV